ncbi:MAG TPA: hypothetical protein PK829_02645, partial [Promineifilum sp.]|nr:hypothetical protein [Promineifilum sp.]
VHPTDDPLAGQLVEGCRHPLVVARLGPARLFRQPRGPFGIDGFLRIAAREPGVYGNQIAVSARASGPAMYDFAFIFEGVPFENARQTVLGKPLAILTAETLAPGPAGVLQAKAAGVHVTVSRERTAQGQALSS